MKRKALLVILSLAACFAGFLLKSQATLSAKQGPRVQVSVQATDASGAALRYRWRVTDGVIQSTNGAIMTWTLPTGPGLHFAYALVSNGLGGYTERRLAINTDALNNATGPVGPPSPYTAPSAPAQLGDYYRSFVAVNDAQAANGDFHDVYAPDLKVYLKDLNNPAVRFPASGTVSTNLRGEYLIPGVAPGSYSANCTFFGTAFDCTNTGTATLLSDASGGPVASTDYAEPFANYPLGVVSGSLTLADGSVCGTSDELFGVTSTASATLRDASGKALAKVRVNEFGSYSLPVKANAADVLLRCENATPVVVAISALDPNVGAQCSIAPCTHRLDLLQSVPTGLHRVGAHLERQRRRAISHVGRRHLGVESAGRVATHHEVATLHGRIDAEALHVATKGCTRRERAGERVAPDWWQGIHEQYLARRQSERETLDPARIGATSRVGARRGESRALAARGRHHVRRIICGGEPMPDGAE